MILPCLTAVTTGLAVQANIGLPDVKLHSSGRSHKPRNLAKSVTVE